MILLDGWYIAIHFLFIALKFRGDAESLQVGRGGFIRETTLRNLEQPRVPE
jgi:hypothetical protein